MIQHKNPVEESFIAWISMYPESFHPLDMRRFYIFVHSVIAYHAKSWSSYKKFQENILFHKPHLSQDIIDHYFNLMGRLIDFSKASPLPLIELDNSRELTVRTVVKGEIVTVTKD